MSRARTLRVVAFGVGIGAAALFSVPSPRLVWNASASAPIGFYWRHGGGITRGDLVLATMPEPVRALAAARGYLPSGVPLLKRVAALSGDRICADDATVFVNGQAVAARRKTDSRGRPMPAWTGCRTLAGEVFLLMPGVPDSFDGRYFGPVPQAAVIGPLTPLWTR
ncbi:MAG: conjugative transfer signal peptidase TraF [Rhodospirillaceae bacterium]|nr:conjugative transfer signal peptidase TraF [Rhodospirillaceae bacterium]